jgi:predicted transcriptional regulator YdeE
MVMPIVGFPAGQSVEKDGVVVTLTYFNRHKESQKADGIAAFMIVNLSDDVQTANISLTMTYGTDSFNDGFSFREAVSPRSAVWRSFQNEKIKAATYAMFILTSDSDELEEKRRFQLSKFRSDAPLNLVGDA